MTKFKSKYSKPNSSLESQTNLLIMNNFQGRGISYRLRNKLKTDLVFRILLLLAILTTFNISLGQTASAQQKRVSGVVLDAQTSETLVGVNIVVEGTTIGVMTDIDGNFTIQVPKDDAVLGFSYIGYISQKVSVKGTTSIKVTLSQDINLMEEVVVVGYGAQKKQSVVGSIAVVSEKELTRRGGVSNLAQAISGQIGGVTVMERTGEPGREDPQILIRGQSTWNGAQPLILVDGIERRMSDIDINEVSNISVLKDASATAVFGVKGANGVILITTKRGEIGRPKFSVSANTGWKSLSRINSLMESHEAQSWRNEAVVHELPANDSYWSYYLPQEQLLRSQRPQADPYTYLYPNVNWKDVMLKDFANDSRFNTNLSGGTEFAKYFASVGYMKQGDLMESSFNKAKGYDPGFSYDRFNFRGNLDFNLTKTTTLSTNLSGYLGKRRGPGANFGGGTDTYGNIYRGLYELAPDAFPVVYPDGRYGKDPANLNLNNPIALVQEGGVTISNRRQTSTEAKLVQKLDFITEGLSVSANVSYDTYVTTSGPNINDGGNQGQALYTYINPAILDARNYQDTLNATFYYATAGATGINDFDFVLRPWTIGSESFSNNGLERSLFYQASANYARTFGRHDITGLALFNRRQNASGGNFPSYREDWVGRVTYSYNNRYFAEFNGAYNGSEMFSAKYRFGFFPSMAFGWLISDENFMKQYEWLSKLKLRGSIGQVGDDSNIPRWGYVSSWIFPGTGNAATSTFVDEDGTVFNSPYKTYREGTIANPEIRWATTIKRNIGAEVSILNRLVTLDLDIFKDNRRDVFISGTSRNIPNFFGAPAVSANLGSTETKGYEVELGFNKSFANKLDVFFKVGMTNAKDRVTLYEDPLLLPAYQKVTGFQIGQTYTQIRSGFMNNWDDVYSSAPAESKMNERLPGDWDIVDFNADGIINSFDSAPYGFPSRPQKTFNTVAGFSFKNFSFMAQLFGTKNINLRPYIVSPGLTRWTPVSELLRDYWTPENTDANYKAPRLYTTSNAGDFGVRDASFLRLKTVELSYTLPQNITKYAGLSSARVFVNGNNLFFWSDFPSDFETGSVDIQNAYPTFKIINMGIDLSF